MNKSAPRKNVLVVFYSRSGTTRAVANLVARLAGCDVDEIVDTTDRRGRRGWVRSCFDAALSRYTKLRKSANDPAAYDLVIVGGPVWASSLSAPVRTYLVKHGDRVARVAFFLTLGGWGQARALAQMRETCGKEPIATLAITHRDLEDGRAPHKVRAFIRALGIDVAADALHAAAR